VFIGSEGMSPRVKIWPKKAQTLEIGNVLGALEDVGEMTKVFRRGKTGRDGREGNLESRFSFPFKKGWDFFCAEGGEKMKIRDKNIIIASSAPASHCLCSAFFTLFETSVFISAKTRVTHRLSNQICTYESPPNYFHGPTFSKYQNLLCTTKFPTTGGIQETSEDRNKLPGLVKNSFLPTTFLPLQNPPGLDDPRDP